MCDYSLHAVRNRPAVEGEPLEVYCFPTGSLGLVSETDLRSNPPSPARAASRWWEAFKEWFGLIPTPSAVCLQPGTRLVLREIPEPLQREFKVGEDEEVVFTKLNLQSTNYRDAIRFRNGQELLIQRLPVGQRIDVLSAAVSAEQWQRLLPEPAREMARLVH
ncbi:MAG TPA: hypothetical protein VJ302_27175 [Blastocatellia bacterium]|nr:hypothetical protein [Blastocatellia bacterium]